MELLVIGHAGARVIVFPTSQGRYFDWENRRMPETLQHSIDNGWVQLICVDSVDPESWFNGHAHPDDKARRHMQYQDYIIYEVLPFSKSINDNNYCIATGASFGAYHSFSIALRFPEHFNRVLGMSGVYDVREWTGGHMSDVIINGSPCEFVAHLFNHDHLEKIRRMDMIIVIGKEDSLFGNNQWFSQLLWEKGLWHAFRIWDGNAHDWPMWERMLPMYLNGDPG
jgi:esterase/lipase superfamily enzyme